MSSVASGSEREEMQEMQELLVNRHGRESLVSQQQAREGPTVARKIGSLTPLPPNIRLQFTASRTPSRSPTPLATYVTLRRSDRLEGPRSPPQYEEIYLQDTNTALTRQLELAHATLQQAQCPCGTACIPQIFNCKPCTVPHRRGPGGRPPIRRG